MTIVMEVASFKEYAALGSSPVRDPRRSFGTPDAELCPDA